MKRVLSMLLCVCLLAVCLTGCHFKITGPGGDVVSWGSDTSSAVSGEVSEPEPESEPEVSSEVEPVSSEEESSGNGRHEEVDPTRGPGSGNNGEEGGTPSELSEINHYIDYMVWVLKYGWDDAATRFRNIIPMATGIQVGGDFNEFMYLEYRVWTDPVLLKSEPDVAAIASDPKFYGFFQDLAKKGAELTENEDFYVRLALGTTSGGYYHDYTIVIPTDGEPEISDDINDVEYTTDELYPLPDDDVYDRAALLFSDSEYVLGNLGAIAGRAAPTAYISDLEYDIRDTDNNTYSSIRMGIYDLDGKFDESVHDKISLDMTETFGGYMDATAEAVKPTTDRDINGYSGCSSVTVTIFEENEFEPLGDVFGNYNPKID